MRQSEFYEYEYETNTPLPSFFHALALMEFFDNAGTGRIQYFWSHVAVVCGWMMFCPVAVVGVIHSSLSPIAIAIDAELLSISTRTNEY